MAGIKMIEVLVITIATHRARWCATNWKNLRAARHNCPDQLFREVQLKTVEATPPAAPAVRSIQRTPRPGNHKLIHQFAQLTDVPE